MDEIIEILDKGIEQLNKQTLILKIIGNKLDEQTVLWENFGNKVDTMNDTLNTLPERIAEVMKEAMKK